MGADWLWVGPLVLLVLFVMVRAAAADKKNGPKQGERPPLFGDETEGERDREQ
jgi:cytochrome c-type biogenesis protein CcmH/NrfF